MRAAVLSLVTVSVCGFWWWDVGRQLRVLGQPADPWRALTAVTVGLLAIVPSFLSVHRHDDRQCPAAGGAGADAEPVHSVVIAAVAVAWFATGLAGFAVGLLIGMIWPLIAMVFAGCRRDPEGPLCTFRV